MAAKLGKIGLPACPPQRVPDVPPLREDLQLFPAAANADGSPAWMIQDPVTNRFFRIGWVEFELLSRWHLGNPALILISIRRDTPLQISVGDLNAVSDFLRQQQLVRAASVADSEFMKGLAKKQQEGRLAWLLHNYLFFRLPLIRPAYFLQASFPLVKLFYSRAFLFNFVLYFARAFFSGTAMGCFFAHSLRPT